MYLQMVRSNIVVIVSLVASYLVSSLYGFSGNSVIYNFNKDQEIIQVQTQIPSNNDYLYLFQHIRLLQNAQKTISCQNTQCFNLAKQSNSYLDSGQITLRVPKELKGQFFVVLGEQTRQGVKIKALTNIVYYEQKTLQLPSSFTQRDRIKQVWTSVFESSLQGLKSKFEMKPDKQEIPSQVQVLPGLWSEDRANKWYAQYPFLYGAVYYNSDVVNELEMWQKETYNSSQIENELALAESLGFNTLRIFLHDLLWQDKEGFITRLDDFLDRCKNHGMKPYLVLFDSCWNPFPKLGPQPDPIPGLHNSRWVQAPGKDSLLNKSDHARLEDYVKGIISHYKNDDRILMWDLWNEPSNLNYGSYSIVESPNKVELVNQILFKVYQWARSVDPSQPIFTAVWDGNWGKDKYLYQTQRIQLYNSDIIAFHHYGNARAFRERIKWSKRFNRPVMCTEYFARNAGSYFETHMPVAKKYNVSTTNWGFVRGRTQTWLPWDSWDRPYVNRTPNVWQHDIFYESHQPYREVEIKTLQQYSNWDCNIMSPFCDNFVLNNVYNQQLVTYYIIPAVVIVTAVVFFFIKYLRLV